MKEVIFLQITPDRLVPFVRAWKFLHSEYKYHVSPQWSGSIN